MDKTLSFVGNGKVSVAVNKILNSLGYKRQASAISEIQRIAMETKTQLDDLAPTADLQTTQVLRESE